MKKKAKRRVNRGGALNITSTQKRYFLPFLVPLLGALEALGGESTSMANIINDQPISPGTNLPKQIEKKKCGIVNIDPILIKGSYWTAYINDNHEITYFYSYGYRLPPSKSIQHFVSNITIRYNYDCLQKYYSNRCRHYCLIFLHNYL